MFINLINRSISPYDQHINLDIYVIKIEEKNLKDPIYEKQLQYELIIYAKAYKNNPKMIQMLISKDQHELDTKNFKNCSIGFNRNIKNWAHI